MSDETHIFPDGVPSNSADFFDKPLIKPTGFREYDVRWRLEGGEEPELNYSGLTVLGKAFGSWLFEHLDGFPKDPQVVVGHDFRSYSQNVKNAFVLGLLSTGAHVVDAGLLVSPALYFAQHHLDIPAGAMITASHNENGWPRGYQKPSSPRRSNSFGPSWRAPSSARGPESIGRCRGFGSDTSLIWQTASRHSVP